MASLELNSTLVLCLLFVVSCFTIVVRGFGYGRRSAQPPSPPGLPIIGNLHQLGRGRPHRTLEALARRHGPLLLLRLGSVRAIVLRRIAVVHLLSVKRVDSFRALREEEVARFVGRVRAASGSAAHERRRGINVTDLIITLTYTVISRAAFGNKLGGVEPAKVRDMMKELTDLLGTIAVSDVFPRLGWLVDWATGLQSRVKTTAAKLDSIMERTITEHEGDPGNDNGEAPDLLDDLLLIAKDGDQGFKLDRIDVKGVILDMFIAGTDTTYKTIEWTMAELIKNPREMAKVQSEDAQLHGYDIPAKTRVMVNTWAIGRDDESWENAEEFRPERFLGRTIDYNGKDPRFLPFGAGRRGCPGIAFGTRLAELTLANMMYHFDWELPDGQDPESFEVVESSGLSPGLKSALILGIKPL
ncbi:Cytochrome P450 71A1 [Triticum urartu]|uniref:Cytochrome P450 71A1 n=1 Tax=Triticum urartu TaxID=4572 RepID=M8ANN9_TRIUA|nr:Cytochrome P450 71A1 [Triticum urartu]